MRSTAAASTSNLCPVCLAWKKRRRSLWLTKSRLTITRQTSAWREIEQWIKAAGVVRTLREGRMGFLGHTYPGMMDMYSDFTMITAQTGMHVEVLEMCDLAKLAESVTAEEQQAKLQTGPGDVCPQRRLASRSPGANLGRSSWMRPAASLWPRKSWCASSIWMP